MVRVTGIIPEGFDWDAGNKDKNFVKHKVNYWECEDIFFDPDLKTFEDNEHSKTEKRFTAYGQTKFRRGLTVVFTLRKNRIRVISARDQNKKEAKTYEEN